MHESADVRLGRIAGKLTEVRAMPVPPPVFGAQAHHFELRPPLPEAVVADFEARHEIELPHGYRLFLTELGDGGAGPGYEMVRLADACAAGCRPGHLAQPSPYLPGPRYYGDWELLHENPPGPDRRFLPGTLRVAAHGCTLCTHLIVTGEARGRLFNLDIDGPVGPYVVEDTDFLAWYERWLDEAVAGYDVGWFGERLPLDEPQLISVLADDPSPARRARAGQSLLCLPVLSDPAWAALISAMNTDPDATVRAEVWEPLRWGRHGLRRRLDDAEALADDIARHARSCTPVDLRALGILGRLTVAEVLSELAGHDRQRRRQAAHQLIYPWVVREDDLPEGRLDELAESLLHNQDPILRWYGLFLVGGFGLTHLHPLLYELHNTETDPWVRHELRDYMPEQPAVIGGDGTGLARTRRY